MTPLSKKAWCLLFGFALLLGTSVAVQDDESPSNYVKGVQCCDAAPDASRGKLPAACTCDMSGTRKRSLDSICVDAQGFKTADEVETNLRKLSTCGTAFSLATSPPDNGLYGSYFQIRNTDQSASINLTNQLDVYFFGFNVGGTLEAWTRPDGLNTDSSDGWTLLGSGPTTGVTSGDPSTVTLSTSFTAVTIPPGATYGMYVYSDDGIRYTNGQGVYGGHADNPLELTGFYGSSSTKFGGAYSLYSPRTFAGTINYTLTPVAQLVVPSVNEGDASVSFDASGSTDLINETRTFAFSLDGNEICAASPTATCGYTGSALYDGPNSYTISVQVCYSCGSCETTTGALTVDNVAPVITASDIVISATPTDKGTESTIAITFIDVGVYDTQTLNIDWNDGNTDSYVPVSADNTYTHTYSDVGSYYVSVQVTDSDGGVSDNVTATTPLVVNYQAPTAVLAAISNVNEGDSTVTFDASGSTDPEGDTPLAYEFSLDGNVVCAASATATCDYSGELLADDFSGDVSVEVCDEDGNCDTDTATLTVDNVAPVITESDISIDCYFIKKGGQAVVTITFTDPGVLDTFTLSADWGNGHTEDFIGVTSGDTFSHTYKKVGTYTVQFTVTDNNGGSSSATASSPIHVKVPLYELIAKGQITTPGATPRRSLRVSDKATFDVFVRSVHGETIPGGSLTFTYTNIAFVATSYESIIVDPTGHCAKVTGSGTVNGTGEFGFAAYACDAEPDTFHMQIWDKENNDAVIYDNVPGIRATRYIDYSGTDLNNGDVKVITNMVLESK